MSPLHGLLWRARWNYAHVAILLLIFARCLKFYLLNEPRILTVYMPHSHHHHHHHGQQKTQPIFHQVSSSIRTTTIETKTTATTTMTQGNMGLQKEGNPPNRVFVTAQEKEDIDQKRPNTSPIIQDGNAFTNKGLLGNESGRKVVNRDDETTRDSISTQRMEITTHEEKLEGEINDNHANHPIVVTTKKRRRRFPGRTALSLIGERHSGTNWMNNHLEDCFSDSVYYRQHYSDWKHWFQIKAKRYDDTAGVVVVAQFRNVFQWIEAMRMGPYHAPLHHDLDWKDFVTKTWTMPRYNEDLVFANVTKETCPEDIMCLYGKTKKPHDIIPCRANRTIFLDGNGQNKPRIVAAMYELRDDGSGLPFENILELRSAKIRNFLKVALYSNVKGFHPIRYEDMVQNGTEGLIRAIEKDLNVTAKCKPIKGEFDKGTRPLMIDYVDYMKRHVDWENEALIGYDSETLM